MNHETLYLAVKLVDHYLVEVVSMRDKLQLIGSTAILIASKFEVTPCVLSWGVGAEGAVALWSPWVTGEGQVPTVPGCCPESCWGGVSVLMLPLPIPRAVNAVPNELDPISWGHWRPGSPLLCRDQKACS